MDIPAVAKRYARALYDLAVEEGIKTEVRADLAAIRELIQTVPELSAFLENPTITPEAAERTIAALFQEQAHSTTLRFIRFLAFRGRLKQLRAVCDSYEQRLCEDLGIVKVKITAAHELSDAQLAEMKSRLAERHRKQIDADVQVEPTLIGGFKVQVGDRVRDFSMLSQLDQFEQSVIHAKHDHPKYKVESWR